MNSRNLAIDMFRGLTMVLMVFVNEFWTVLDVPHALEHYGTWEDGMGLSDLLYPMFLFAFMCLPYLWIMYRHVPDTTGKTLEEIEEYWAQK